MRAKNFVQLYRSYDGLSAVIYKLLSVMSGDTMEKLTNDLSNISETQWRTEKERDKSRNNGGYLRSRILKRSVLVGRHRTSISIEDVFWNELRAIAQKSNVHLSQLVSRIDAEREHSNLSSAIRLFVFEHRTGDIKSGIQAMNNESSHSFK